MENDDYKHLMPAKNSLEYQYIQGNSKMSISRWRSNLIIDYLAKDKDFKIAFRDIVSNSWTRHQLPSKFKSSLIANAYDMHRSILFNEICLESDYENYIENVQAARHIGTLIETLGFKPLYFYSGSKSIHIHIFVDFSAMFNINQDLQEEIINTFESKQKFITEFMLWIRTEFISCFGMETYLFDKAFLSPSHMVRAEFSKNKKGYKCFLGYSAKDIPDVPLFCNPDNMNYPDPFELRESFYEHPNTEIKNFLNYYNKILTERKNKSKMYSKLENQPKKLRKSVQLLLADNTAKQITDGRKRCMWLLINELKYCYPAAEVEKIALRWNSLLPEPLEEKDIRFRANSNQKYKITNKFIDNIISELNLNKENNK